MCSNMRQCKQWRGIGSVGNVSAGEAVWARSQPCKCAEREFSRLRGQQVPCLWGGSMTLFKEAMNLSYSIQSSLIRNTLWNTMDMDKTDTEKYDDEWKSKLQKDIHSTSFSFLNIKARPQKFNIINWIWKRIKKCYGYDKHKFRRVAASRREEGTIAGY